MFFLIFKPTIPQSFWHLFGIFNGINYEDLEYNDEWMTKRMEFHDLI